MKRLKVSIIILSWNTRQLLRQCLKSLMENGKWKMENEEIIVVDNGSTDGSPQMVAKEFPAVKLIRNKTNLGFAKGNNIGIKAATGDLIMLLNSDTIVKRGAIEKLAVHLIHRLQVPPDVASGRPPGRNFDLAQPRMKNPPRNFGGEDSIKSPKIAAVSPLLLNEDGSIQKDPCYLKFPSPITALFYYNPFLKRMAVKFFPRLLFSTTGFSRPTEVDQLPGAAIMLKREVLKKIKGLDENYSLYFEDTDLSWRLRKKGYQLMVIPQAEIVHLGRKSIQPVIKKEGIEKFYFLNFNSLFLFCEKNYSKTKTWLIKLIVFLHLASTLKFNLIRKLIAR